MEKRKACKLSKNGLWAVKTCAKIPGGLLLWMVTPTISNHVAHQKETGMLSTQETPYILAEGSWILTTPQMEDSHLSWNFVFFPAEFSSPTPRRSSRSESLLRRACHGWIFSDAISLAQPSCLERFANNQGSSPFCMWRWSENGISYPQMAISMGILIKIHNLKIEGALDSDKPEN